MKNNKRKYISAVAIAAMSLLSTGCAEDFLSTSPITSKTDVSYYLKSAEFNEALVGAYDAIQRLEANGFGLYMSPEMMSDECLGGSGSGDGAGYPNLNAFIQDNAYTENLWEEDWVQAYKVINRVNTIISKIDQAEWKNEAEKNGILSEAKTIRAFTYLHLVRTFGQCVLLEIPSQENKPCSDYKAVYDLIFKDLKDAATNGSDDASPSRYGHANKYVAEALLGRAYLFYTGYYGEEPAGCTKADAKAAIDDIVSSGKFALQDNPFKLWPSSARYKAVADGKKFQDAHTAGNDYSYAGETNNEFIFSIRHTELGNYNGSCESANWICNISVRTSGSATKNMQKYGYFGGWGINTVSSKFVNSFESGDLRKEASVVDIVKELGGDVKGDDYGADTQEYTGYCVKKYMILGDVEDPSKAGCVVANPDTDFMIGNPQDNVVIRYADVLLMQSELNESVDGINAVRKRAGLEGIASYSKEALFNERWHELCFEGQRWFDMLRYDGIKDNFAYAVKCFNDIEGEEVYSGKVAKKMTYDVTNFLKHKGLCPIPLNQITISGGVIEQNDGWK